MIDLAQLNSKGLKPKETIAERISILKTRLIAHDTAIKRVDFFELQEIMKDIIDWLTNGESKTVKCYHYKDSFNLM